MTIYAFALLHGYFYAWIQALEFLYTALWKGLLITMLTNPATSQLLRFYVGLLKA